ncbi:MAG: DNA cytosine methyltransferase [Firmicutes bacterium]|nr:DNA cytosine methyltransferase [Bacillota bacterium]MCL1953738.1 DNA cytosine methyltransferase [Bacillota bacterium]
MSDKVRVVDLFCGVGGLSYGFYHNKNFDIVLANDIDKDAIQAYQYNHPNVKVFQCDIKHIDIKMIGKDIKLPIDVVVGGPPCQSYSTLGKRSNDDRANLFKEYIRLINILEPKIFIYENVTGLVSMLGGTLFQDLTDSMVDLGYSVDYKILNTVQYGIPQIRERVIVVGTKIKTKFVFPNRTHGNKPLKPYITMRDALSDLPILQSGEESDEYDNIPQNDYQQFLRQNNPKLTEHQSPNNGKHLIKLMQYLPDGGTKDDLPQDLRPKSGYKNTYAKLWWDRPVPTVTRNFSCVSSSRCIHPRDSRALTTREGARLQSFPDDFQFCGSRSKKNLQIGNAVPPLLSIQLAKQVLRYLKESENNKDV